jgi:hypothetical protein
MAIIQRTSVSMRGRKLKNRDGIDGQNSSLSLNAMMKSLLPGSETRR